RRVPAAQGEADRDRLGRRRGQRHFRVGARVALAEALRGDGELNRWLRVVVQDRQRVLVVGAKRGVGGPEKREARVFVELVERVVNDCNGDSLRGLARREGQQLGRSANDGEVVAQRRRASKKGEINMHHPARNGRQR